LLIRYISVCVCDVTVIGRFDHNMAGLENGESNSEPTLKK